MELKEFIKLALLEVCDGIAEARTDIESKYQGNCIIAPAKLDGVRAYTGTSEISFDLSIQLEKEDTTSVNGRIGINVIGIGEIKDSRKSETVTNRISFSVPFIPQGLRKNKDV